ncbi:sensor histidine kinase [Rhodospirillum centenum]|uniref:histidine kinase n=1 Tax=Rhodospirillum centenum (strain ATCC 51521 / SW) TaxID=414684 RepID=B6IUU1_RHOCS|nr:histidine kinase dimerization/phosphoacceptor domain -containing protein [Rhodospirillum centenum]ACJ00023.1 sensory transduction histidine kinase, putative [Rhodospirillum centenum SW]
MDAQPPRPALPGTRPASGSAAAQAAGATPAAHGTAGPDGKSGPDGVAGRDGKDSLSATTLVGVAAGVVLLFVLAILLLVAREDRREMVAHAGRLAANTALLLAEQAGQLVAASEVVLDEAAALAGPPDAPIPDTLDVHRELRRLVATWDHANSVYLMDAGGRSVVSSREFPMRVFEVPERHYLQVQHRRTVAGEPPLMVLDRVENSIFTGGNLLILTKPLPAPTGIFRGVAGLAVAEEFFRNFYQQVDVGFGLAILLLGADRQVLVRHVQGADAGAEERTAPEESPAPPAPPPGGMLRLSTPGEGDRLYAEAPVRGRDLRVMVGLDATALETRWRERLRVYLLIAAIAATGVAGLGLLALRWARREAEARDRLEEANHLLEQRVGERTAELSESNAELELALKDREVLFREVHHRVKNNLQLVSSLLRLQAMRLPAELRQGFEDSLSRIQSMSLVHELLYRTNQPSRVDFADYLRRLAPTLAECFLPDPDRIAIEVAAEPLELELDTAIPLGLLAGELITNALKHAFPDGRAGCLTVRLERGTEGDGVLLTIADDGVGLAPGPADTRADGGGLGMVLVQSLAAQVQATLSTRPGAPGTRHHVLLPGAVTTRD